MATDAERPGGFAPSPHHILAERRMPPGGARRTGRDADDASFLHEQGGSAVDDNGCRARGQGVRGNSHVKKKRERT